MRSPTSLRDPYRRSLQVDVLACRPRGERFLAVTRDTIVYPGGGGQPPDHATLAGRPVRSVLADADGAWVHELEGPVPPGPALLELDWDRRYDHMQQHSAQHLITALARDQLGLETVAFHLGPERSSIDLDRPSIEPGVLGVLSGLVQAEIRAALSVRAEWIEPDRLAQLAVRSRGLPEGHRGGVRIVSIEGVDRNTCGGTHVANTAELQLVAFLGTERVREATRLHFVAGGRALQLLEGGLEREAGLTRLLSCGAAEQLPAVERLLEEQREQARRVRALGEELAQVCGSLMFEQPGPLAVLHRQTDDLPLLQAIAREALRLRPHRLVMLTSGEPSGSFLLAGPDERVATLGPELAALLEGRGGGARGRYQGRAERLDLREQAIEQLRVRARELS
jgi:misacylated tRNA(Ala) deacylase